MPRSAQPTMIRTNVYLSSQQRDELRQLGDAMGMTSAAVLRLAIDEFINARLADTQKCTDAC